MVKVIIGYKMMLTMLLFAHDIGEEAEWWTINSYIKIRGQAFL